MTGWQLAAVMFAFVACASMGVVLFTLGRGLCEFGGIDHEWAWTFPVMVISLAVVKGCLAMDRPPPGDGGPVS